MGKGKKDKAAPVEDESEEEVQQQDKKPASKGKQKDGLNYTAIGILLMFVLPMVIAGAIQVNLSLNREIKQVFNIVSIGRRLHVS